MEKWDEIRFSDLFSYIPNNTFSRAELNYELGECKNVHYGDVLIKFGPILDAESEELPYITGYSDCKNDVLLMDGDVIIADTAEDETVGKATEIINIGSQKIASGLHTIACRPVIKMAPTYLGFYINTENYHKQLFSLMQGVKVLSISKSNIEGTIIRYPQIYEQTKICSLLNLLEGKITKQKKLIEHLKKYKRGLHYRIFSRLSNSECEKADLRSIATFCGGGTPSKDVPSYWNGNIGWISSSDIHEEWVDAISVTRKIHDTAIINSATKLCPPGTIAIVSRVGVGKVALMSESLCTSQDFTNITSIRGNNLFMTYQIAYKMKIEAAKTQGTSIKGITAEEIKALKIDIPTDDEQCFVATMLSSFDIRLRQEIHKANCLRALKNALLQQLFI